MIKYISEKGQTVVFQGENEINLRILGEGFVEHVIEYKEEPIKLVLSKKNAMVYQSLFRSYEEALTFRGAKIEIVR